MHRRPSMRHLVLMFSTCALGSFITTTVAAQTINGKAALRTSSQATPKKPSKDTKKKRKTKVVVPKVSTVVHALHANVHPLQFSHQWYGLESMLALMPVRILSWTSQTQKAGTYTTQLPATFFLTARKSIGSSEQKKLLLPTSTAIPLGPSSMKLTPRFDASMRGFILGGTF